MSFTVHFCFDSTQEDVAIDRTLAQQCELFQGVPEAVSTFDFDVKKFAQKGDHFASLDSIQSFKLFFNLVQRLNALTQSNTAKAKLYDVFTDFARTAMKMKKTYKAKQSEADKVAKAQTEEQIAHFNKTNPSKKELDAHKASVKDAAKKAVAARKKAAKTELQDLLGVLRDQYYASHTELWAEIKRKEALLAIAVTGIIPDESDSVDLSAGLSRAQWMQLLIIAKVVGNEKARHAVLEHIGHDFGTFADRPEWESVWVGTEAYNQGVEIQRKAQELLPAPATKVVPGKWLKMSAKTPTVGPKSNSLYADTVTALNAIINSSINTDNTAALTQFAIDGHSVAKQWSETLLLADETADYFRYALEQDKQRAEGQ